MKPDYFFEASWEVCNKVGGIYSVITTKALQMLDKYKSNYFAIGPFFPNKNIDDKFQEAEAPVFLKEIFEELLKQGIACHFGKWLIEGEPNTILIDYSNYQYKLNEIKKKYWDLYRIDSLNTQFHDYDEPILWSTCAGIMLEKIKQKLNNKNIVVQAHEWLSGGVILHLKSKNVKIGKVFTTHATMLGRTLATNNISLYEDIEKLNPEEMAYKFGVQAKFHTERACSINSDVFTTVSEITGIEASYLLGKSPDILLPNGIDTREFPTFDEASVKHKLLKSKILRFLMFYFFPYYEFDLDETLIFFIAGRYEFKNKGIDVYIEALSKLNKHLINKKSKKTIAAFIWVPANAKEIKPEIMENKTRFQDIEDSINDVSDDLRKRLIYGIVGRKKINQEFLLGKSLSKETVKRLKRLKKKGNPPVCTHNLYNEEDDIILRALKENGLENKSSDKVKAIFYPIYLTGADHLTDLNYFEAIMASHLGVFPSYYEPWGYTPMETGALGVSSVTTDLAGFGRFIQNKSLGKKNPGIYLLEREGKTKEEAVEGLFKIFLRFIENTKQDRIENKLKAKNLADTADWNILSENYFKAHKMALEKANK